MATTLQHLNDAFPLPDALAGQRPLLLVSGCLLGEAVRYDGGDKSLGTLRALLQAELQLHSVCPEVYAGMGIPRPPVQWVASAAGELQLLQVDNPQLSAREQLLGGCQRWCERWQGNPPVAALLKARSPSCGHGTTPLVTADGELLRYMDGAFVQHLKRRWPQLWLLDEEALASEADAFWLCRLLQWRQLNPNAGEDLTDLLQLAGAGRLAWWQRQITAL